MEYKNLRLVLSIAVVAVVSASIMAAFELALTFLIQGISILESVTYTVIFATIMTLAAVSILLLKLEMTYRDMAKEEEMLKYTEEALRESEANLSRVEQMARIGHWTWDLNTNRIDASDEAGRIFEAESGAGQLYDMMVNRLHPEDRASLQSAYMAAKREGKPLAVDCRIVLPDRDIKVVHNEGDIKYDERGRPCQMRGITMDITVRKQAEMRLQEYERFQSTLISNLPGMVYRCRNDSDLTMEYVSDGCQSLTGYSREDMIDNRMVSYNAMINPCDREYVLNAIQHALHENEPYRVMYRIFTAEGVEKWVWEQGRMVENGGLEGFITDISERKAAEKELKNAKMQAELYLDLMGHDINNLNQVALGYLELAQDMLMKDGDRLFLNKPAKALQRSSGLIDNVRKLQRIQSGDVKGRVMNVEQVLQDVKDEYNGLADAHITLNLVSSDSSLTQANELLQDVFANLVDNAIKHSSSILPEVYINFERAFENDRWYHKVSVEDNGPGVPDELKPRIFNRLLRGNTRAKGSGIGLYLVKTLVEEYNGRVWVEDRVPGDRSKGSRFIVMLPAVEK